MHKEFSYKRIDLFIVAISILLTVAVLNLPFKVKPFGDDVFHIEAKNMALFLKGKVPYEKVTVTRAPGPVVFFTAAYLVAPSDATDNQLWGYGVVLMATVITISMLLIFRIGVSFFSREVGLLAVLLFFVFPIHCYYSFGINAEAPAFFSMTLAIYGWSRAHANPKKILGWILLIAGLWFLIINRPNTMMVLGLGFVVVIYAWFWKKQFFQAYGKKLIIAFFAVGIFGFGALELAKKITEGKTSEDQNALLCYVANEGRFQFREEPTDWRYWDNDARVGSKDYDNWIKKIDELDLKSKSTGRGYVDVYKEFLIGDALEHPFLLTRQFFVKCIYGHFFIVNSIQPANFHLGPLSGPTGFFIFMLLINAVNLIIIFGAVVFFVKYKNLIDYWIFWSIIIALLIFHGLTYMEPRYLFPSKVALCLMSAAGLYEIGFIKRFVNKFDTYLFPEAAPE